MLINKETSSGNIPELSEETRAAIVDALSNRVQNELGITLSDENLDSAIMELSFRS